MAAQAQPPKLISLPTLPAKHSDFVKYVAEKPDTPIIDLLEPYKQYDAELRKVFAQQPDHPAVDQANVVPVFAGQEESIKIRARRLSEESQKLKESYIMPLKKNERKPDGSPAVVPSLKDFKTNFALFSEQSLVDMDWSNVVVAGSAVVTSLLPVPKEYSGSKRALREYYHEKLAPASDVDLFLYGLTESEAIEKIKQIEQRVRDSILTETTTIRTKHAITIVSQYPTRHIQIVLRIYRNISEILTGFDVDCSCAAFDGNQVYASPRALVAYMTQRNTVDLTRRSPSYENRLSKYSHRGFEVYWPLLDRSRIDPTIFERSFGRTEGLARLLILEKLPKSTDRDAYLDQRRAERGRPAINRWRMNARKMHGNVKDNHEDEVAEWVDSDEISDYIRFTIPYGPQFHAKKIEKLFYTKDLLLNSEWNKPKDREVNLHRHPAFFGTAQDVMQDCCGYCPKPITPEEEEVTEEESKIYISGKVDFIKDDPGRQTIGSFNPITDKDWTEMAYVGNTARLCQAIVECDLDFVENWFKQEDSDANRRDYTGRTPLQLAAANSTPEIVQCLIDHGARLVARLVDGKTALHLAALRGSVPIVSVLLRKSEENEEEESKKDDLRKEARKAAKISSSADVALTGTAEHDAEVPSEEEDENSSDVDMLEDADEDEEMDATTENSFVKVKAGQSDTGDNAVDEKDDEPDVYDVNVLGWDVAVSPLHLAIVNGHIDVVKCLVQDFGADILLPVKLLNDYDKSPRAALLTLVLALQLPMEKAEDMARTLIALGATMAQADMNQTTALQYYVGDGSDMLSVMLDADKTGVARALNHVSVTGYQWNPAIMTPLLTAIQGRDGLAAFRLLTAGAKSEISFNAYIKSHQSKFEDQGNTSKDNFNRSVQQPVVSAVQCELPLVAKQLVDLHGANPNTLTQTGWQVLTEEYRRNSQDGTSLLDLCREKLAQLHNYQPGDDPNQAPVPLAEDSTYFEGLGEAGSYEYWSASKAIESARKRYAQELEAYQKAVKGFKEKRGVEEKKAAIQALIYDFEQLEASLLRHGAKTFKELHPDIEEPKNRQQRYSYHYQSPKPEPFKLNLGFRLPEMTDEKKVGYTSLFEAAWSNDIQTLKSLTLSPWREGDEEQAPLKVAVQDNSNFSPFSLAILRGHHDLAKAILEVAQVQYAPPDPPKQERFSMRPQQEDEDEESESDDEVHIYSDIVDDKFTVDNIGEVSMQVKSKVTPCQLMAWSCPVTTFLDTTFLDINTRTGQPNSLMQLAMFTDDKPLLLLLLDLVQQYLPSDSDGSGAKQFLHFTDDDFLYAIELGRTALLSEIIRRTGAGMPLDDLVKKSGVEIQERPKYYQGLSVYGKKRADWANAGRGNQHQHLQGAKRPPLLHAAFKGSLDAFEWFSSDTPRRCYIDFADSNKDDKRLKYLAQATGGFEGSITRFLNARSHLTLHCAIMGKPTPVSDRLVKHIIDSTPDSLEAKSASGQTPLHLAFSLRRHEAAKILIEAGADQTCRDKAGNNLIHTLVSGHQACKDNGKLREMLELVDARLVPSLFTERSTEHPGSVTPLVRWLSCAFTLNQYFADDEEGQKILRTILDFSEGAELAMINGEGDTPLHLTVKYGMANLTRIIVECDSALLFRENATGRTPVEMAEDSHLAEVFSNPPQLPDGNNGRVPRRRPGERYWGPAHGTANIVDVPPENYVSEPRDERSGKEKVWGVIKEWKVKTEGKAFRRLVSLLEANEVAKRLASNKREDSRASGEAEEDEDKNGDEVEAWRQSAGWW